ncbi:hypothetical protein VTN02DRAFT_1333 [Thermoascus thermophilus]
MMAGLPALPSVDSRTWRKASRCVMGTCRYVCFSVGGTLAWSSVAISVTKTGGLLAARGIDLSARTSGVTVAVNRSVWRSLGGGSADRHVSTSGSMLPGPLASIRSASSSTTMRTRFRPQMVSAPEVWMWSARRPGVAMTTCGRCESAMACGRMSVPPVTRIGLRFCGAEMALNCSKIWSASSLDGVSSAVYVYISQKKQKSTHLVGVNTTAKMPNGSSAHFCRIGTANAIVFPDPVRLPPMQSRPFRISGIHAFWMAVGRLIAIAASDPTSQGATFSAAKFDSPIPICRPMSSASLLLTGSSAAVVEAVARFASEASSVFFFLMREGAATRGASRGGGTSSSSESSSSLSSTDDDSRLRLGARGRCSSAVCSSSSSSPDDVAGEE